MTDKYVDASAVKEFVGVNVDDFILEMAKHRRSIKLAHQSYVHFVDVIAQNTNTPKEKREDALNMTLNMLPGIWTRLSILNNKIDMISNQFSIDLEKLRASNLHPLTWKRLQYLITGQSGFESYLDVPNPPDMRKTPMGVSGMGDMGIAVTTTIIIISVAAVLIAGTVSTAYVISWKEYRKVHESDLKFSIEARQQIVDALEKAKNAQIKIINEMNIPKEKKDELKLQTEKDHLEALYEVPSKIDPPKTPSIVDLDLKKAGEEIGKTARYIVIAAGIAAGAYVFGQYVKK